MAYLHPDKLVSAHRILIRKKARKSLTQRTGQKPSPVAEPSNLVENLAAHLFASRAARG